MEKLSNFRTMPENAQMLFRSDEEINTLVESFENRTILKREWTHAAHLTVGLCYVRRLPFMVAKNVMRDGIHWLNDTHGTANTDSNGYHETLTVFWLKRIWNFVDARPKSAKLVTLANDLIRTYHDPEYPLRFYSRNLLFSPEARRCYHPPDLHSKSALRSPVAVTTLKPLF